MQYHNDHVIAIPQVLLHRIPSKPPLFDGSPEDGSTGRYHTSSVRVGRNRNHSSATEPWNESPSVVRRWTRWRLLPVARNSVLMWHGGRWNALVYVWLGLCG